MLFEQWLLPKRREHLVSLLSTSSNEIGKYPIEFQGEQKFLLVYTIDIEMPAYRLSNGRTQSAQKEYVAINELDTDFFTKDPDSLPAQEAQEEILIGMIKKAGLYDIFRKDKQKLPLILDRDGFVINGNRRLCVMRKLLKDDQETYRHFKYIQVIILPHCTQKDIEELEASLQIAPEGKADYEWTDIAMLYLRNLSSGATDDEVAKFFDIKLSELRETINMLSDADRYLEDRGEPGRYSRVINKEEAFRKLQKHRQKNKFDSDEPKKDLFTNIAYLMLDSPETAGGRLYEKIPDAEKYIDNLQESLGSELEVNQEIIDEEDENLDLLSKPIDSDVAPIITAIRDPRNKTNAMNIIQNTLEELRRQESEIKDANFCRRQIQTAETRLQSALSSFDESTIKDGISDALNSIEEIVDCLWEELNEYN